MPQHHEGELYDRRWWALAVLCLSLVLIVAGNSSLNVGLPSMQRALRARPSSLQWAVDVYSLVFAGLLLPAGALADRYGRKTALQFGLVGFAGASLAAMASTTIWQVVVFRAVTGVAAAFIMPGTLSILTNIFPPQERGRAISIWAGFAGFGGVIGVVTSGLLLERFYWGSLFLVNVPIAAVALGAGAWLVPNSKHPEETTLDPPGALLAVAGLGTLLFGIIQGPERGWLSSTIVGAIVVGLVLLAAFVAWELRTPQPMLDVRLFTVRPFSVGSGTIALQYFALYGLYFAIAQYFQLAHGYSPLKAALVLLPLGVFSMVGAPVSAPMVGRFGARRVVGSGLLVTASGFCILAFAGRDTSLVPLFVGQILIGMGVGQTTAPSTTLIMSSVRMAKAGVGSAVNDTSREVGGALGIAVLGSIMNSVYRGSVVSRLHGAPAPVQAAARRSVAEGLRAARAGGPGSAPIVRTIQSTFAHAFGRGMLGGAGMLVLTAGLVWALQERTPGRSVPTQTSGPGPAISAGSGTPRR